MEVVKTKVLRRKVKGVRIDKERLGPDDVNLQTEELHCNYSVLIVSAVKGAKEMFTVTSK